MRAPPSQPLFVLLEKGKNMANDSQKILAELVAIKKLLVLSLLNNGMSQGEIGKGLGVSQQRVSQIVPFKKRKEKQNAP